MPFQYNGREYTDEQLQKHIETVEQFEKAMSSQQGREWMLSEFFSDEVERLSSQAPVTPPPVQTQIDPIDMTDTERFLFQQNQELKGMLTKLSGSFESLQKGTEPLQRQDAEAKMLADVRHVTKIDGLTIEDIQTAMKHTGRQDPLAAVMLYKANAPEFGAPPAMPSSANAQEFHAYTDTPVEKVLEAYDKGIPVVKVDTPTPTAPDETTADIV